MTKDFDWDGLTSTEQITLCINLATTELFKFMYGKRGSVLDITTFIFWLLFSISMSIGRIFSQLTIASDLGNNNNNEKMQAKGF